MKQGFSLGMDVTINKDGVYDAAISYVDTENNTIKTSTQGKNIEEVCWNLYKDLEDQVLAIEEKTQKEDMSDKDYIQYLEDYVKELKAENAALRKPAPKPTKQKPVQEKPKQNNKKKLSHEEELVKQLNKIFDKYGFGFEDPREWFSLRED